MKRFLSVLIVLVLTGIYASLMAESPIEAQQRQRKQIQKESSEALNKKASKLARQDAKKLRKEGWQVTPGALPLEKQLDRCYLLQNEIDENGYPAYLTAEAMSVGASYDAAKMQALELAKQQLAAQIQTELSSKIKNSLANDQIEGYDAESVTRSIAASEASFKNSIERVLIVTEAYRMVANGRREVLVRIAYSQKQVDKVAQTAIKKALEDEANELHEKLDSDNE